MFKIDHSQLELRPTQFESQTRNDFLVSGLIFSGQIDSTNLKIERCVELSYELYSGFSSQQPKILGYFKMIV